MVATAGFNDRSWLDMAGHPHSERLHVTERFQRTDFGLMQFQVTFDDPETMNRPLTIREGINYTPDTEMLEGVCVGALPLIAQSETIFQEFDGTLLEFSLNGGGAVTGATRMFGENGSGFFRKQ